MGSSHQDEVPQTPVTPVSAEGLASLHNLIKQDAHTLNETSIPRLERRVQKLVDAAQMSFAERALLHDQKQMLTRMNNEAKVRRSTRLVVLGKVKVMSFKDIEVARAARAAKDILKGKRKRGRKRKSDQREPEPEPEPGLETEQEPEPEPEMVCAAKKVKKSTGRRAPKRTSIAEADLPEPTPEVEPVPDLKLTRDIVPETWSAPVAQMC